MNVLFAGGGTGGHLFPGISVAEELKRLHGGRILFLATSKGIDSKILGKRNLEFITLGSQSPPGNLIRFPLFAARSALALVRCLVLLRRFKPDVVVGLGGYGAVPAGLAAVIAGVPLVLMEQNILPGRATRFLSRWASLVCTSFAESSRHFREGVPIKFTGNPIRREIFSTNRREALHRLGLDESKKTLLVLGGSQGASPINRAMTEAAGVLAGLRDRLQVIHQTGPADIEEVRRAYAEKGIRHLAQDFFEEMHFVYAAADLAISRAGATTIAELAGLHLPAILVPYPLARDDHQRENARVLARAGAAVMVEQSALVGEKVSELLRLLFDEESMGKMRSRLEVFSRRNAAEAVALEVLRAGTQRKIFGKEYVFS